MKHALYQFLKSLFLFICIHQSSLSNSIILLISTYLYSSIYLSIYFFKTCNTYVHNLLRLFLTSLFLFIRISIHQSSLSKFNYYLDPYAYIHKFIHLSIYVYTYIFFYGLILLVYFIYAYSLVFVF